MNGSLRFRDAKTIEEKLAALAVDVIRRHPVRSPFPPDYADFRDAFRSTVRIELLLAKIQALEGLPSRLAGERRQALVAELLALDVLPEEPGP